MQFSTITLALLAGCLTATPITLTSNKDELPPPGLVLVEGGRTKIGTSFKDMVKLIEENKEAQEKAGGFLSEVPQHSVNVDDYYMMVTEVTSEQYREYVLAKQVMPPYIWGGQTLDDARDQFLKDDNDRRQANKAAGKAPGARAVWDPATWWEKHWKDAEWSMPEELAKKPVIYVDYEDAKSYAEWAGLRLPTEFEWERAVRGNTDNAFAWGDDWETAKSVTKELRATSDIAEVGKYPDGATADGIHDMHGNVWEWTASKYLQYPGFKHKSFSVGKGRLAEEIDRMPKFSPQRYVVRGGCQQNSKVFARASTRGGFDRYQKASALGFRCAASVKPGFDFAQSAYSDIPNQIRPQDAKGPVLYDTNQVIARDRWISNNGESNVAGYQVITKYDYILFTPVTGMQTNGLGDIRKGTQNDEIYHLGFLATNQDLIEPALRAGTYLVALRGEGKYPKRAKEEDEEGDPEVEVPDEEEELGQSTMRIDEFLEIDPLVDNYIFIDMTGTPVAAMPALELEYGNPKAGTGSAAVVDKPIMIEVSANDPKDPEATEQIEVMQQWLDTTFFIKGRSRKGMKATLSLRFEEGLLDGDWR